MSLSEAELEQHCQYILKRRSIRNRIVILCEGVRTQYGERLSPQVYSKMEELPDANFYRKCIPVNWTQKTPCFFNCGDRNDTIVTYFKLLEIHDRFPELSYLSTDRLFALVDVDLNIAKIEDYHFPDTEVIFHDLYRDLHIKLDRIPEHRIGVTGVKHKEGYFLNPDLQHVFDEYSNAVTYQNNKFRLENIYRDMATELDRDGDIKSHFTKVAKRIGHCQNLDRTDLSQLSVSWQQQLAANNCKSLLFGLLSIVNSKLYWERVEPDENYSRSANIFRDALSLQIAREFYAKQDGDSCSQYHLPCFFKYLYECF
jgi:hypothetical protein